MIERLFDRMFRRHSFDPVADLETTAAIALEQARALAAAGDYVAALAIWGPLAHRGVARAANNVGACFMGGLGVEVDQALAVRWLTAAAEAGDPAGQRNLASAYLQGKGIGQSDELALRWYREAASLGDAQAQDMASWMLLERDDAHLHLAEAHRLAQAAADAGIASAMTRMGMIHHNALGVERDPEAAVAWWGRGVAAGDPDAMAMLGAANHLGQGVEPDPLRAMVLLILAKRGGSALAETFFSAVEASLSPAAFENAGRLADGIAGAARP